MKFEDVTVMISNTTFYRNIGSWGGGMLRYYFYCSSDLSLIISFSGTEWIITALYMPYGSLTVDDTRFVGNSAIQAGGALYGGGSNLVYYSIRSLFNLASQHLHLCSHSTSFNNSTFVRNYANFGATLYLLTGEFKFYNSSFKNNSPAEGVRGGVLLNNGGERSIYRSCRSLNSYYGNIGTAVFLHCLFQHNRPPSEHPIISLSLG